MRVSSTLKGARKRRSWATKRFDTVINIHTAIHGASMWPWHGTGQQRIHQQTKGDKQAPPRPAANGPSAPHRRKLLTLARNSCTRGGKRWSQRRRPVSRRRSRTRRPQPPQMPAIRPQRPAWPSSQSLSAVCDYLIPLIHEKRRGSTVKQSSTARLGSRMMVRRRGEQVPGRKEESQCGRNDCCRPARAAGIHGKGSRAVGEGGPGRRRLCNCFNTESGDGALPPARHSLGEPRGCRRLRESGHSV